MSLNDLVELLSRHVTVGRIGRLLALANLPIIIASLWQLWHEAPPVDWTKGSLLQLYEMMLMVPTLWALAEVLGFSREALLRLFGFGGCLLGVTFFLLGTGYIELAARLTVIGLATLLWLGSSILLAITPLEPPNPPSGEFTPPGRR